VLTDDLKKQEEVKIAALAKLKQLSEIVGEKEFESIINSGYINYENLKTCPNSFFLPHILAYRSF
jgi:hypothetical protein